MFFMILYEQSHVLNELIRVNDSLWDKIENNGEVILAAYDCYWWGRQTSGQGLSMDWVIQEIPRQIER